MHLKRLAISLAVVVFLLVIAGVLEVLLVLFPAASDANAELQVQSASAEANDSTDEDVPAGEGAPLGEDESSEASEDAEETDQPEADERSGQLARASGLVDTGAIVVDGTPLQLSQAEAFVEYARPYVRNVAHVDQLAVLPSGCEIVALSVALDAEGYDASPTDIAENHLRRGADFATGYIGSPAYDGGGLPPCIVEAAGSWLRSRGASAQVVDLTRTSFAGLADLVALGYPVVTWTTENMADPYKVGEVHSGLQWYNPEHCVVVYGVEGDEVLVSDSLEGLVRRDRADFERIYEGCGSMAMFVVPAT